MSKEQIEKLNKLVDDTELIVKIDSLYREVTDPLEKEIRILNIEQENLSKSIKVVAKKEYKRGVEDGKKEIVEIVDEEAWRLQASLDDVEKKDMLKTIKASSKDYQDFRKAVINSLK